MSSRSQASLSALALGLTLSACADVHIPGDEPRDQPDAGVRPTVVGHAKPRMCWIDPSAVGDWESAEGPREVLSHRLAATPGALFVASPFALRRSSDGGQSFELVERPTAGAMTGPMAALGSTLFVGTDVGAVRSEDGGETWVSADAGLDGAILAFHRGKAALLARSSAGSLLHWSAAEAAWEKVESGSSYAPGVAASDGKTVLVDTGAGVLRSTDLAAWSLVSGLEAWGYKDLLIADDLGLAITAAGDIRRSADAGVSWLPAQQSAVEIGDASRVMQHGDAMFALTTNGVARSADGGASWGIALATPPAYGVPEVAESSDVLAVELGQISVTSDGGATWSDAATFTDSTPLAFARAGSWLFTSTDAGGVFASNAADSFLPTDVEGFFLRDSETSEGTSFLLFSQRPAFAETYGASWATLTRDGGDSFEPLPLPSTGETPGRAFETIAVDGDVILAGGVDPFSEGMAGPGVWASSDGGESWSRASDGLPDRGFSDGPLYPAVVSLSKRSDTVFALLANEGVFQTRDQGQSWQRVGELPAGAATGFDDLVVAGDALYLSSRAVGSVWRFDGTSWVVAAAAGLPTVRRVAALTAVGASLIAAVHDDFGGGMYMSNDHGETWQSLGLDVRARALFVDGETLWAGVEGQGSFSIDIGSCR
jgi:hypothetical protein